MAYGNKYCISKSFGVSGKGWGMALRGEYPDLFPDFNRCNGKALEATKGKGYSISYKSIIYSIGRYVAWLWVCIWYRSFEVRPTPYPLPCNGFN